MWDEWKRALVIVDGVKYKIEWRAHPADVDTSLIIRVNPRRSIRVVNSDTKWAIVRERFHNRIFVEIKSSSPSVIQLRSSLMNEGGWVGVDDFSSGQNLASIVL